MTDFFDQIGRHLKTAPKFENQSAELTVILIIGHFRNQLRQGEPNLKWNGRWSDQSPGSSSFQF